MSAFRPALDRRASSIAYAPLPADDDAEDYVPARPSHIRENSRSALLTRSVRSVRQVPPLALADMDLEHAPSADKRTFRNADGTELDAQQRKMALVSEALEATGMGRYQWSIFLLCGFGYALDLAWAQAFGLIMPRVQAELGIADAEYGTVFAVFSAGLTAGALVWGMLVDVIGRRWAFNLTVAVQAVFGTALGALDSYAAIVALTFGVGFGLGGNIPIDATITLEFLPQDSRYLLVALSVFQPLGSILTSLICWVLIPKYSCAVEMVCSSVAAGVECCTKASNYGWRYTLFTIGALSIGAFLARFALFHFRESPRFLITQGRDAEAVAVCEAIARTNGRLPTLTLDELSAIDAEAPPALAVKDRFRVRHLARLFASRPMAALTLLTWGTYMADFWGFTIAGSFLPKILAERGAEANVGIDVTYRNYILIALAGVPGVLGGAALVEVPRFGRKWAMVLSSAAMAASFFAYAGATTFEQSVALNAVEYFFQSTFNAVLYAWTPEAFPAAVRGSAAGLASFWGRLASIAAPAVAARASTLGQLYLAGGGVLVCTALTMLLPDTRRVDVL